MTPYFSNYKIINTYTNQTNGCIKDIEVSGNVGSVVISFTGPNGYSSGNRPLSPNLRFDNLSAGDYVGVVTDERGEFSRIYLKVGEKFNVETNVGRTLDTETFTCKSVTSLCTEKFDSIKSETNKGSIKTSTISVEAGNDCVLGSYGYLIDDDGTYILDDDGGRIIVNDENVPFPNLLNLEKFKKSFQGFWMQMIEQFVPATTIFVGGEKWCNGRICDQKVVSDYLLDVREEDDVLSPRPVETITPTEPVITRVVTEQTSVANVSPSEQSSTVVVGERGSTNTDVIGPVVVGDTMLYALEALDPELSNKTMVKPLNRGNA